jgi:hypothetical protein
VHCCVALNSDRRAGELCMKAGSTVEAGLYRFVGGGTSHSLARFDS